MWINIKHYDYCIIVVLEKIDSEYPFDPANLRNITLSTSVDRLFKMIVSNRFLEMRILEISSHKESVCVRQPNMISVNLIDIINN